jgi:hypothetical protein
MTTKALASASPSRLLFAGIFLAGFALCTRGIGAVANRSLWLQPAGILGVSLGVVALLVSAGVLTRTLSARLGTFALLGIIVAKIAVAILSGL